MAGPGAGNPKHEYRNPKQARISNDTNGHRESGSCVRGAPSSGGGRGRGSGFCRPPLRFVEQLNPNSLGLLFCGAERLIRSSRLAVVRVRHFQHVSPQNGRRGSLRELSSAFARSARLVQSNFIIDARRRRVKEKPGKEIADPEHEFRPHAEPQREWNRRSCHCEQRVAIHRFTPIFNGEPGTDH